MRCPLCKSDMRLVEGTENWTCDQKLMHEWILQTDVRPLVDRILKKIKERNPIPQVFEKMVTCAT